MAPPRRNSTPPKRRDVFFAYPSHPQNLVETIDEATTDLARRPVIKNAGLRFKLWPNMSIAGSRLLSQITDSIDRAAIFACDVTYPNANVAFELGYAIATYKRLWISLDTTITQSGENFKRLYTGMLGAGYRGYENYLGLAAGFLSDHPWESLDQHLLAERYRLQTPRAEKPVLLRLIPPVQKQHSRTVIGGSTEFKILGLRHS